MILSIEQAAATPIRRIVTDLPWLDSITGGGLVRGSATLVHGEPGAGKSTMLAQLCGSVAGAVYASLEEDLKLVAARFRRLGLAQCGVRLAAEPDVESLLRLVERLAPPVLIVDSLQLTSSGAVEATRLAVEYARRTGAAVVLVCHETKGGQYAGPRTIEHYVDCTLRVLRAPGSGIVCEKNRYGAAGVWLPLHMTEQGLVFERPAAEGEARPRARRLDWYDAVWLLPLLVVGLSLV